MLDQEYGRIPMSKIIVIVHWHKITVYIVRNYDCQSLKRLTEQSMHDKEMLPCDKKRQAAETSSMGKVLELSALYMLEKCT